MDGGQSEAALRRIESALARIEAVVRHRDVAASDWEERNRKLREAIHKSVEQLDQLIERQDPTGEPGE